MSTKAKILLVLAIVLGGLAYFIYSKNQNRDTLGNSAYKSTRDFAISDTGNIERVFATNKSGMQYLLEKKNGTWYVDKHYEADQEFVNILLQTLTKMDVKNLVPKKAIPNIMTDIATLGRKIEVYYKNNQKAKVFYIGRGNQDDTGVYMVLEGSNIPYEIGLPHFPGNIGHRFWPVSFMDIRSRIIAKYKINELKHIKMDYPRNKAESFEMKINGAGNYDVSPLYATTRVINSEINRSVVESYLSGYEKLIASSVKENNLMTSDSLISDIPFLKMEITDKNDKVKNYEIYPILTEALAGGTINLNYIPNNFFIKVDEAGYYTGQRDVLKKIFYGYSYFYR